MTVTVQATITEGRHMSTDAPADHPGGRPSARPRDPAPNLEEDPAGTGRWWWPGLCDRAPTRPAPMTARGAILSSAAVILALTACGSAASPSGSSGVGGAPSAQVVTGDAPATSTTYAARTEATIPLAEADGMVAEAGALWVKTDDGQVARIDPVTNAITDQIQVDQVSDQRRYCQGIGSDGASVWACAMSDADTGVAQIDPGTRRIVRVIPAGKVFDQLAIPATRRGAWVLTGEGTSVAVVEPASQQPTSYPLGVRCLQLAAQSDRVVATCATANRVLVVDAATGTVVRRAALNAPRMAALSSSDLWVDTADGLTRLTRDLGVRTVYRGLIAGPGGDVFAAGDSVWLRGSDGTITRIDAASGRLLERITPESSLSGGSLIVAFGSIWTTANNEGRVIRLRLNDQDPAD